jgi:transposase, IS30 family
MNGTNHKVAGVTMIGHQSRYGVIAKITNKTSELVSSAIVDKLKPMAIRFKSLTFDNWKEFATHAHINEQLQSTTYFARPLASCERSSDENL